jgi:hypothetical protein
VNLHQRIQPLPSISPFRFRVYGPSPQRKRLFAASPNQGSIEIAVLVHYTQVLITQMGQTAPCNHERVVFLGQRSLGHAGLDGSPVH